MENKTCAICKESKPLDDFYQCDNKFSSYCNPCRKSYKKNWDRVHGKKRRAYYNRNREYKLKRLHETETHKQCSTCDEIKPKKCFRKMGGKPIRHCSVCYAARCKEYRERKKKYMMAKGRKG